MAPLAVDPVALDGAGAKVISTGEALGSVISTLTTALAGCGGMAGDDPAGAAFGRSYDRSGSKLLEAMVATRNGFCGLGYGVRMSAFNYSVAEAMSNVSGHGNPLPAPPPAGAVRAGSTPSAVGAGVGAPAGWGWVAPFIGMIWPDGDSAKLRAAAAAWISAGTNFEVSEITGAVGPMGAIGAQQIPEGPAIAAAFGDAGRSAAGILQQCVSIAAQLTAYAARIDQVHAKILDLLSRICDPITGVKEVWEILTDQDEDEIKKIADDIRVIVNQFTTEVDALRQQIATAVTEAETILTTMGRYAEKEWDHFLHGTPVGRAINQVGQFGKGLVEEGAGLVKDGWTYGLVRAAVDPQGWYDSWSQMVHGMAPLVGLGGDHAPGVADAWKTLGKNAVHWDEWSTNPAEAAGKSTFDIASLFVPGGGEAAAAAKGAHAAVDGAEAVAKTAPREAAATRVLGDVPKSAPHPPEAKAPAAPHAPEPHDPAPHDLTPPGTAPHGPPEAKPAAAPHDTPPDGSTESKPPVTDRPVPNEGPRPPVEPAAPGDGPPPPPPGGSPPPPAGPHSLPTPPSGEGPPPAAGPPPPPPPVPGEGPPPVAEPPQPAATTPLGDGPRPTGMPHEPAPTSPQGEHLPPGGVPHEPVPSTPSGEGHLPAANEPNPSTAPSEVGHTPADQVPQLVTAGSNLAHLPLGEEAWTASAPAAHAAVSAGAKSAELAPKAAHAVQPGSAVPPGRPSHLSTAAQPHERSLTHTPTVHGGRPAEPSPPPRAHGRGHGDGGGGGDHGSGSDGAGEPPRDPVHSHEPSGDGWERLPDEPPHPHYGEPLEHHWECPHDPTDPSRIHPDVAKLIKDPDAPFGRDPQGHAYTQHEYEERFNKEGPDRQHWYNFASDDGALAGTKVAFHDLERYKDFYGNQLDRVGNEKGRYLGVVENGHFAPWEERAMHVDMMSKPLHTYTIENLPDGWKVEVSEIEPAVGQPGGAMQVRILDQNGKPLDVETLLENRVLREHD
jgi:Tuberculosis necrotizing toxin